MKILLVHNYYKLYGGEDGVFEAERQLLKESSNDVFSYIEHNDSITGTYKLFSAFRSFWSFKSYKKVLQLIRKEHIDLVHFHNTFPLVSPSGYRACRKAGVPVVQTLHNYRLFCPCATFFREGKVCTECLTRKFPLPGIVHRCYRNSRIQTAIVAVMVACHRIWGTWRRGVDVYIALSQFAKNKFVEGGLPADKIIVKPNFIYPDPGTGTERGGYVVSVGRLSQEKGLWGLLRSWSRLKHIPLEIIGSGPLGEDLEREIKKKKLSHIKLKGQMRHEEVIQRIQGASFCVFTSECFENFPLTIIESFACGTPIIASRQGVMAEIIEDQQTGLLFNNEDVEDLSRKAIFLWENKEISRKIGANGRREFEKKYFLRRNYQILMRIYKNARKSILNKTKHLSEQG